MRVRAIDVGGAGGGGTGISDRVRRALLGETAERRLRRELDGNPPDVAVAFDPHAALALSVARDQAASPAPVVAVVGELEPVIDWRNADADRYLVVDDIAAVALAEHGVEDDRIMVVGPLGERAYVDASREDRGSLRARFGLKSSPILVDVAGIGAEAAAQLALQLSLVTSAEPPTYLFAAGADVEVAAVLRRHVPTLGLRAKLFGATSDAPLLWRSAEVVVARPAPAAVARALHVGARLVTWIDDGVAGAARLAAALEHRKRAVTARSALLVSGAIEAALKMPAPAPAPDGADGAADVICAVAGDKRGVIDERQAAARAATREQLRNANAAAGAAVRVTAAPGELEDLSGPSDLGGMAGSVPDAAQMARLRTETKDRVRGLQQQLAAARAALDRPGIDARTADVERTRMNTLLIELATLETELAALEKAHETVRGSAGIGDIPRPTRPTGAPIGDGLDDAPPARPSPSVDDALADLKRRSGGGGAKPTTSARPGGAKKSEPSADDALAALKRKMAGQSRPKKP